MSRKHFDHFNGTGSLGAVSFWDIDGATAWTLGSGEVSVDTLNTNGAAVNSTDANFGLPSSWGVYAVVKIETGTKYAGVCALATGTSQLGLVFRWEIETVQRYRLIHGSGIPLDVISNAQTNLTTDGETSHVLAMNGDYQYTDSNGDHVYRIGCWANGQLVIGPIMRTMIGLSSAANHRFGIVGRTEGFGVPSPRCLFETWFTDDLTIGETGEPAPAIATEPTRTPITITDETPSTSPATFPFEIKTASVRHVRSSRIFETDMGYDVTHPRFANSRRTISAGWVGTESDKTTLQAFFDARFGSFEDFNVTIRAQGIGSLRVVFAEPELTFTKSARNTWRTNFDLVEVYT